MKGKKEWCKARNLRSKLFIYLCINTCIHTNVRKYTDCTREYIENTKCRLKEMYAHVKLVIEVHSI